MSDPTAKEQLLAMFAKHSFGLGEFKLSSGATSDYYIDCRMTTLHAEGARLTGRVVLDAIREQQWQPEAIGGMTMGADPIVTAVNVLSSQEFKMRDSSRKGNRVTREIYLHAKLIHGFLVRKAGKAHGTGRLIEGFLQKGAQVVIVDDVCTTGASTIQAIEAAREAGMHVVGVICLVEREEAGGRDAVERTAYPAPFISIFKASDVRAEHMKNNQIVSHD
jgi:orotate phosphoribosyltransferase